MIPNPQTRIQILINGLPIRDSVNSLLTSTGGLNVCLNSARAFLTALHDIENWWLNTKPEDQQKDNLLVDTKFMRVIQTAKTLETVLNEELVTLEAYLVSKKGIYSTSDLIDHTENILPSSVLIKLSPEIVREIKEGGKCLAFDMPTASGFHMLRATESVLYEYYLIMGEPTKKDKLESWGAYISYLYKLTEPEVNTPKEKVNHVKKVLALLQQVKDWDRNQIMHTEVVLNSDEAYILFQKMITAIMAMSERLSPHQPYLANIEPPKIIKAKAVEPPKLIKIEAVEPPKFTKIEATGRPSKSTETKRVQTNKTDKTAKKT